MIEVFFSYAHEDEVLMDEVRRQLIVYERENYIRKWHDRKIPAGSEWKTQIDNRIKRAAIILLFMSPSFIESKYCYEIEGQEALKRHEAQEAVVIPIILRPCAWQDSPFGKLQALPADGKPITTWDNMDEASFEVAKGIIRIVKEIKKQ